MGFSSPYRVFVLHERKAIAGIHCSGYFGVRFCRRTFLAVAEQETHEGSEIGSDHLRLHGMTAPSAV